MNEDIKPLSLGAKVGIYAVALAYAAKAVRELSDRQTPAEAEEIIPIVIKQTNEMGPAQKVVVRNVGSWHCQSLLEFVGLVLGTADELRECDPVARQHPLRKVQARDLQAAASLGGEDLVGVDAGLRIAFDDAVGTPGSV